MPKKYLTVNEVAKIVGVTPLTVRNWDKKGRLVAYRHPVNNYRLYKTEDVESLMNQIEKPLELTEPKLRKLKVEAF
ncbi:MAG: MerR family DNA-binding transcriptional regulator [Patescibacteria group bacterium]